MPPLKPWHRMPVPPPTLPSATAPGAAARRADRASSRVTLCALMSLSRPSYVSATSGRVKCGTYPCATPYSTSASRTTPTAWVFVMPIGVSSIRFLDPRHPCHLASAVERVHAGEREVAPDVSVARHDHGHARAHRPGTVGDQRPVAHAHAGHVGDRVRGPRGELPNRDAEVGSACAAHTRRFARAAGLPAGAAQGPRGSGAKRAYHRITEVRRGYRSPRVATHPRVAAPGRYRSSARGAAHGGRAAGHHSRRLRRRRVPR